MKLPKQLTTQTKESKYLSFLLFLALPIIAGFIVYINMREIWDYKLLRSVRKNTDLRLVPLQNNAGFSINEITASDILLSDSSPDLVVSAYGKVSETKKNNTKTGYYPVVISIKGYDEKIISNRPYFGSVNEIFSVQDNKVYVTNASKNSIDIYENIAFIQSIALNNKVEGKVYGISCEEDTCKISTGIDYDAGCTYSISLNNNEVEEIDCFYAL